MSSKGIKVFKIVGSIIFSILILGGFGYLLWKGEPLDKRYLALATTCLPFLFALVFIGKNWKRVFLTLGLGAYGAAFYFMGFAENCTTDKNKMIGLYILCGAQFFFLIYTLFLSGGNGGRVVNLAVRVALCLIAYLILPKYITLTNMQMVALLMCINLLITMLITIVHIKTEWLTFVGMFVLLVCHVYVGFMNGGLEILKITNAKFIDFLTKRDWAKYAYVPSLYLIALSSVFAKKKEK